MKTRLWSTKSAVLLAAALFSTLLNQPSTAFAQGNAFTYQGRLNDGANPATGIYDLGFALFDAGSVGTQQGNLVTNTATVVSNGLFTVTLDFGYDVFTGDARWLEIGVRTNGGGGTSTGGVYSVTGTIGQPDAGGSMTNGQYSVTGGFWALPQAVQTDGAPMLKIVPATPGNATLSWTPPTGTNWVLQETLSLSPTAWTNSPSGTNNPITVPAALPKKFYRLFKP